MPELTNIIKLYEQGNTELLLEMAVNDCTRALDNKSKEEFNRRSKELNSVPCTSKQTHVRKENTPKDDNVNR